MADETVIRVEKVSKNFILPHERADSVKGLFTGLGRSRKGGEETQHALKDISFDIKKGEFFGIVGRNGSGKSTLLKILAGIYQPTTGRTYTRGKLVPFIELGVGFNPDLTGRENVYLNGAMLGFSEKEVDAMYDDIVSFAELQRFMDQKLKNYSSGMQVRLAFSMAIRAEADILLIDEVLAVGDADFQRKCFDYFKRLKGDNTTVVFVSHNMNDIREYCTRALLIDKNEVVGIGDADTIAKRYSRLFIEDDTSTESGKTDRRWGNRSAVYESVTSEAKTLSGQKDFTFTGTIVAKKRLEDPIIGFSIKNAANQSLTGSNNLIEGRPIKVLEKGQKLTVTWSLPNIFSDGRYTVDATVMEANGAECDWWEDAVVFSVKRAGEHAPYLTAPPIKLKVQADGDS